MIEDKQKKESEKYKTQMQTQKRQQQKQTSEKIKLSVYITPEEYSKVNLPYILGNNRTFWKKAQNEWMDSRVNSLRAQLFTNKIVLDIGCREGFTTLLIGMKYFPYSIQGVDIYDRNIQRAKVHLQKFIKTNEHYQNVQQNSNFITNIKQLPIYFQQKVTKLTHTFTLSTHIIVPHYVSQIQNHFPNNIAFINQNIFLVQGNQVYDTILCFKVTKWIHLCYGDQGFYQLITKIIQLLKKGGILILEAQNWGSYKKKKQTNILHKQVFSQITLKPCSFTNSIIQLGLVEIKTISNLNLKYPLKLFQKPI